ncbi:MAG: branched-chain amino acid ABC transporter permease [Thermodesulfobacteriota bacterium]|nr:branched-chain amino acid ABC transporter permease [Thermodesulfobacteriota bacterium]
MELLVNILINGLVAGGIYALLAIGFALIFGVGRILNMSHTAFYMLTGFLVFIATSLLGLPLLLSTIMAIVISSLVGVGCYKLFIDRVREHETAVIIVTVALALLFQEIFLLAFSGQYRGVPSFISGFAEIAGNRISYQHLIAIATSVVTLIGVWLLLSKTKLGNAIRAVAQDREIASLMGIDVSQICMITMGISITIAGVAASVSASIYLVSPLMWMHPLVIILAAVVLGGLGSLKGSIFGAFLLGFAETAVVFLIQEGGFLKGSISLSVMVLVMLLKPEGLFGVVFEEERL